MTDTVATVVADTTVVVTAAQSTWSKLVTFVKKWSGYAATLEPLWIWWYHCVGNRPKTFAGVILILALLALR